MRIRNQHLLYRYRLILGLFIFGLLLGGVTAFAFEMETALLNRLFGINAGVDPSSFFFKPRLFITTLHFAVHDTYVRFPFFGHNTDWLGFSYFVIGAFFLLPFANPVRYRAILQVGLLACAGAIMVAVISGSLRHIPFFWIAIDCSFGMLAAILLAYSLYLSGKLGHG